MPVPLTFDSEGLVYPSDVEAGQDQLRLSANVSYATQMWTFQDAVEHVLDTFDLPRDVRAQRLAKRAVLYAHRMFPSLHQWPYYRRLLTINTLAPYATGTIDFDYGGGAYERQVTLSDGTWPSWSGFGVLRLENIDYPVLQRVSGTVITLSNNRSPADDLSAESFVLYRSHYPLPVDFRRHDRIIDQRTNRELCISNPGNTTALNLRQRGLSTPYMASIVEDERHIGGLALQIATAPSAVQTHSFLYERQPRPLNTEKYATGTVEIAEDSAVVLGTGTAFSSLMIGSVLRISADDTLPSSPIGSVGSDSENPAAYTRIIMGVEDATTLAVDQTLGEDAAGRAFTVSDPVDVHVQSMLDGFLRCCEWEFARMSGRKDSGERMAQFFAQLDLCRDAVRHSTAIQGANPMDDEVGYSLIGSVNVRPDQ